MTSRHGLGGSGLHIALVSPFDFLPGEAVRPGRYGHLSRELAARGHRVSWLSSTFSHQNKRKRREDEWRSPPGIELLRIEAASYPSNIHFKRLVSQGQFAWSAKRTLEGLFRQPTPPAVVVIASPPLLAPLLLTRVARAAGAATVVDIIDLWPDAFERFLPRGPLTQATLALPRWMRGAAHRAPDLLAGVAQDYLEHAAHVRKEVLHLGHDMAAFDDAFDPAWNLHGKGENERWIVYVGTVSHNYDLRVVLDAAKRFSRETFWIVGTGEARDELLAEATRRGRSNVRFPGRMSYPDLANLVARADVGLLGLNARARIWFPYKTFDYLAGGLKVVTTVPAGELHDLIEQERLGVFYREGDADSLATALEASLRAATPAEKSRIREVGRRRFSSAVIYPRYADLIESLAAEPRRP